MYSSLVISLLLTELCTSQWTSINSTAPAFTVTPILCDNCYFAAATAAASPSFSALNSDVSTASPTASYVVFTAYSITSEFVSGGRCVTDSGQSVQVLPPFSVLRPTSTPASEFQSIAGRSFLDYLGFSPCTGEGVNVIPTPLVEVSGILTEAPIPSTSAPVPGNSTETPIPGPPYHRLDEPAKVGIGTAIPVAVTALLVLALLLWRRSRRNKKANASKAETTEPEANQPYLQRKAELEAEEKRQYELEAEERRYELDGESRRHEIQDGSSHTKLSSQARQELRGEEHSRELEVP